MNEDNFTQFVASLQTELGFELPKPFWHSPLSEGVYYGSWGDERRRYYIFLLKNGNVHCATSPTRRGPFNYDQIFKFGEWPDEFLAATKIYFRVN